MKIYTKKGDDGTTGLLYGGRVLKNSDVIEANGAIDEAQSTLGIARSFCEKGSPLEDILISVERDLWIVMGEVATEPSNRHKLAEKDSLISTDMIERLEKLIDECATRYQMPNEFVIPGSNTLSAQLDMARTIVRRAERRTVTLALQGSLAVNYLNRLSDLLWSLARWQEEEHLLAKSSKLDLQDPKPSDHPEETRS